MKLIEIEFMFTFFALIFSLMAIVTYLVGLDYPLLWLASLMFLVVAKTLELVDRVKVIE